MSKQYQRNQKVRRAKMKAAKKNAAKAQYAAWRDAGTNSKRDRIAKKKEVKPLRAFRQRKRGKRMATDGSGFTQKQHRNTMTLEKFL